MSAAASGCRINRWQLTNGIGYDAAILVVPMQFRWTDCRNDDDGELQQRGWDIADTAERESLAYL